MAEASKSKNPESKNVKSKAVKEKKAAVQAKNVEPSTFLKKGDKVEWQTPQGKTQGTVKRKVAKSVKVEGYKVKASENNPQVLVESDKTGKQAVHKPSALKKVKGNKMKVKP
jgi:Hypervirulence associated proteins TUDOR domain